MKLAPLVAVAMAIIVSSCSPTAQQSTADSRDATSQPPQSMPRAVFPDGAGVDLELALTAQEISTGLSYRPSLPHDRGMLFVFDELRYPSFWMKDMRFSLDLVYLDETGMVVHVEANVPPCAADPCPTYPPPDPALAVLEVNAGMAAAHGIEKGTVIQFENVPGYPAPTEE